ncbi:MAG TPA: hypothetical protein VHW65_08930 [Gemmatimonadales bacterium]|nr:hypothetical protein [Gemmatimonadales bacterium]
MKIWKAAAIILALALAVSVGARKASAAPESAAIAACGPGQPNMSAAITSMKAALQSLKDAQGSLKNAEKNKGGWRVIAINQTNASMQSIDKAIAQTNIGCAAAN